MSMAYPRGVTLANEIYKNARNYKHRIILALGQCISLLIISCIFVYFIGQCSSAWKTVIKVMLSLQDGVV